MAAPSDGTAAPLVDQTVRLIISPHLGGNRVRLHLTNRFGTGPLRLRHVTIATTTGKGGVVGSTLRTVRFGGRASVTISRGRDVVSDRLLTPVRGGRKLAVSIAVSGRVAAPTEHLNTREVNYSTTSGSGDHTRDTSGASFSRTSDVATPGWYFLEGLDVRASNRTWSVVTLGDSITDGFQGRDTPTNEDLASVGKEQRYPDFLQRRLRAANRRLSVLNAGISGNRVLRDGITPLFGPRALDRLGSDVIRQPGVRDVIVLEGINDIGQTPGLTAAELIAGYRKLIARLHAAHLRVLLGTLTPSGGTVLPTYGLTADSVRVPVNRWIRRQKLADRVIDFDRAVRDPSHPSQLRRAYDGSDHLHFSPAGYRALANAVPLRRLIGGPCAPKRR